MWRNSNIPSRRIVLPINLDAPLHWTQAVVCIPSSGIFKSSLLVHPDDCSGRVTPKLNAGWSKDIRARLVSKLVGIMDAKVSEQELKMMWAVGNFSYGPQHSPTVVCVDNKFRRGAPVNDNLAHDPCINRLK